MTEHEGLPVKGYQPQSAENVNLVNKFKETEERLLRECETLRALRLDGTDNPDRGRWASIAFTHFQEGFMALNRAVFLPSRLRLPEDGVDMRASKERPDDKLKSSETQKDEKPAQGFTPIQEETKRAHDLRNEVTQKYPEW